MHRQLDMACRALAVALVLLIFAAWAGYFNRFDRIGPLSLEGVQPWGGKAFVVGRVKNHLSGPGWMRVFYAGGDSNDWGAVSQLQLLENGEALSPAHSIHADIAAQGGGRYSHWGDYLVFSTRDGSDPRTNGRLYTLILPISPWRVAFVPALVLCGLVLWRQRHGLQTGLPEISAAARFIAPWRRTISYTASIGLAVYIFGIYVYGTPPVPLISSDSFAYWSGSGIVPIGYPAFLWAVVGTFGSLRAVVLAQVLFYCASVIVVQAAIERLSSSSFVGAITAIALLLLGSALTSAIWLYSESLFTSLLLLHVAAAGWAFARQSRLALIAMAVTALAAVAVRPAGYFLFGGILFLLMFWVRERRAVFRWAVCPLIVLAFIYFNASLTLRGEVVGGNSGLNLFPHIAHLFEPPPDLSPALAAATSGPKLQAYKEARRRTTSWIERQNLETQNFNPVMHEVVELLNLTEHQKILLDLATHTIKTHPGGYIKLVAENFYSWLKRYMFLNPPEIGNTLSARYQELWQRDSGILDFTRTFHFPAPEITPAQVQSDYLLTRPSVPLPVFAIASPFQPWVKGAFLLIGGVCVIAFVLGYGEPGDGFVGYVVMLGVGGALLVSLSTVFIGRYAIPLEPFVLITVTAGAGRALRRASIGTARLAGLWPSRRRAIQAVAIENAQQTVRDALK